MKRQELMQQLEAYTGEWDIIVIGGGATGLGTAVDAASRGYKTLLLEQLDFAKGTSSKSTKLVHGGVRYLQQGNVKLVMEALKERGILKKNAPHLVKNQSFIVPNYKWWEGPYYGLGLKVYDWMSGSLGLGPSQWLSAEEVLQYAPTLEAEGLRGGVIYHDGQFDDARLAINLAQTATEQGALVINYCKVNGFLKANNKIAGVEATDTFTGKAYAIKSKAVINATGVFSDTIRHMDDPAKPNRITPSQGIHIMLDHAFLPGEAAIMIPHTDDGRVLFAVPWHNKIIVGTTDTPVKDISPEPVAMQEEVDFILHHAARYLSKDPTLADVKSIYAGLRPLVKAEHAKNTSELSRDHVISVSESGLVNILGGKWTTYRRMAEDVVNTAVKEHRLSETVCRTPTLPIHGSQLTTSYNNNSYYYGSDWNHIEQLYLENPAWRTPLHTDLPYTQGEIIWAVRNEYCMRTEDALCRRTRAILLDARAAIDCAPLVTRLMAGELGKDESWIQEESRSFTQLAQAYLPATTKS